MGHIPCCRQLQCLPPDRVHVLTSSFDRAPKPISGSLPLSWFPPTFRCCNDGNAPGWPQSGGMTPCRSIQHASINVRVPCRRHWENEAELEFTAGKASRRGSAAMQVCATPEETSGTGMQPTLYGAHPYREAIKIQSQRRQCREPIGESWRERAIEPVPVQVQLLQLVQQSQRRQQVAAGLHIAMLASQNPAASAT